MGDDLHHQNVPVSLDPWMDSIEIPIQIIDDISVETEEKFIVSISSNDPRILVGTTFQAEVYIMNDDSKPHGISGL